MRLQDIYNTASTAKLLDLLLANPNAVYFQADLARGLDLDKGTVRRAVRHLAVLGLIDIDARFQVKVVSLKTESEAGKALLAFHECISALDPIDRGNVSR